MYLGMTACTYPSCRGFLCGDRLRRPLFPPRQRLSENPSGRYHPGHQRYTVGYPRCWKGKQNGSVVHYSSWCVSDWSIVAGISTDAVEVSKALKGGNQTGASEKQQKRYSTYKSTCSKASHVIIIRWFIFQEKKKRRKKDKTAVLCRSKFIIFFFFLFQILPRVPSRQRLS